jgi:HK97 family phage prohead protease
MNEEKLIRSFRSEMVLDEREDGFYVQGWAIRFNEPSNVLTENGKQFREVIDPASVAMPLADKDVDIIFNYNHDDNKMLARYNPSMGVDTLRLEQRSEGVWVEAKLPDTVHGQEVREHMRNKNLYGMSFVFYTSSSDSKWSRDSEGVLERRVMNIRKIADVSVVRRPAYPTASAQMYARAMEELNPAKDDGPEILSMIARAITI